MTEIHFFKVWAYQHIGEIRFTDISSHRENAVGILRIHVTEGTAGITLKLFLLALDYQLVPTCDLTGWFEVPGMWQSVAQSLGQAVEFLFLQDHRTHSETRHL
jgi:hypothetical protein